MLLTLALVAVVVSFVARSPRQRQGGPRLRPQDPRITAVLKEGVARSATFRALVDRIEASNVFVYVAVNPLMKSSLAGTLDLDDAAPALPLPARRRSAPT